MLQPSPILRNARLNWATSKERRQRWPRFRLTRRQTPKLSAPLPPLILRFTPLTPVSWISCKKLLSEHPDDFAKRLELAVALNGAGQRPEATDQLLHVIRKKRDWNEDAARKQLVQFFEAWGPKDEATLQGRRKLSAILFS